MELTTLVLAYLVKPVHHRRVEAVGQFGANVRAARLARGWTQEDLAHESGLASVQVSRIERGKREVRLTTLVRLIRALGIPPSSLFDGLL